MRLNSTTTENAIWALRLTTGAVVWTSASEHLVGRTREGYQPFTLMSDGDIIAHDWADASAPALVRIDAADGSIGWSVTIPTNVVGADTLDSDKKLATTSYNYNGTEYVVAVGRNSKLNIFNAATGAFVDSTNAPSNVDTEIFLSSNAAFCDTLTPPVIVMTTTYYDPASTATFAWYAGYFNGMTWTPLVDDWQTTTAHAEHSSLGFVSAGYDSLLHGPIVLHPGLSAGRVLAYDLGRDVTNKSIATRPLNYANFQSLADTLQQALTLEPEAGLMQMFKSAVAVTDSAAYFSYPKWKRTFDPSPYAIAWIEGRRIFLNAAGALYSYEQRVPGTNPPARQHGSKQEIEP